MLVAGGLSLPPDISAAQRIFEERGEEAHIEDPGQQRDHTNDYNESSRNAIHSEQAEGTQEDTSDDADQSAPRGGHKSDKWVHFEISLEIS
jgi:hypothetical protein